MTPDDAIVFVDQLLSEGELETPEGVRLVVEEALNPPRPGVPESYGPRVMIEGEVDANLLQQLRAQELRPITFLGVLGGDPFWEGDRDFEGGFWEGGERYWIYPEKGGFVAAGDDGPYVVMLIPIQGDFYRYWTFIPDDVMAQYDWAEWDQVARAIGQDGEEMREYGRDPDPMVRAHLMEDLASYYGWNELDHHPQELSMGEAKVRFQGDFEHANAVPQRSSNPSLKAKLMR